MTHTKEKPRLISRIPDAYGECIICKKDDTNTFMLKNVWNYGSTKWHELSELQLRDLLKIQFKFDETKINSIINF